MRKCVFCQEVIANAGVFCNAQVMQAAWLKALEIKGISGTLVEVHLQPGAKNDLAIHWVCR